MMGRLRREQEQLFYSFCLEEVVPDDHLVRAIAACSIYRGSMTSLSSTTRGWDGPRSTRR